MKKLIALSAATVATAVSGVLLFGPPATARTTTLRADLRDPSGRTVGSVQFRTDRHATHVEARLRSNAYVAPGAFHGFHVHANNVADNGSGCLAGPRKPGATWFVSADGHLSAENQSHGHSELGPHNGDLPSPLVMSDGTARLEFTTDRIAPENLRGTAVILHAKPDNFGNIPVGTGPEQYSANTEAARTATAKTGNAGDRVACGLVRKFR